MRGVKFEDLENDSAVAELVPHPEIPSKVMAQMREDVMIRVPPNPLTLNEPVPSHHEQAERICATVASWGRQPTSNVVPAPIYSRHDLLTAESADRIIKTLHRKAGVYRVEYVTEPTVDGFHPGIRFLIYDDVAQSRPMYVVRGVNEAMPVDGFVDDLRGDKAALAHLVASQRTGNDILRMCMTDKKMLALCSDPKFALRVLYIMDPEDMDFHCVMLEANAANFPLHYLAWVKDMLNDTDKLAWGKEQGSQYSHWMQKTKFGPRPDLGFGVYSTNLRGVEFVF